MKEKKGKMAEERTDESSFFEQLNEADGKMVIELWVSPKSVYPFLIFRP